MTHEELLKAIYFTLTDANQFDLKAVKALRAVVELHKPTIRGCAVCLEDNGSGWEHKDVGYPCPTIQAIEKELA